MTNAPKSYFAFWTNNEIQVIKNIVNELKLFLQTFNGYDEPGSLSKDALSSHWICFSGRIPNIPLKCTFPCKLRFLKAFWVIYSFKLFRMLSCFHQPSLEITWCQEVDCYYLNFNLGDPSFDPPQISIRHYSEFYLPNYQINYHLIPGLKELGGIVGN